MMALASAAVLLPAAAAALMAMAALQLPTAAAAAPSPAPAPIGQPGCDTTCGNVSVLYPFGFGPSRCHWPGLNLTCNTSDSRHPRLLLSDGSLRVIDISLKDQTVRVMRAGSIINATGDTTTSDGWNASFGGGFTEHGYQLSMGNELVVSGCNGVAMLFADIIGERTTKLVGGCASFCVKSDHDNSGGGLLYDHYEVADKYCTGTSGCCLAPLTSSGVPVPNGVQARWLYGGDHASEQKTLPLIVFAAEQGLVHEEQRTDGFEVARLLLDFGVTQGLPPHTEGSSNNCSQNVQCMVCKSGHSDCVAL